MQREEVGVGVEVRAGVGAHLPNALIWKMQGTTVQTNREVEMMREPGRETEDK
jgi:hypothetical protein